MLLILSLLLVLCSGCYERREPKNLGVINSALYDVAEDGLFKVTIECMKPGSSETAGDQATGGGGKFVLFSGVGSSVREAMNNNTLILEGGLFLAHARVRFLSEAFAKGDLKAFLDSVSRDYLTIETPLLVVVQGDEPDKVFESALGLSDMMGNYIFRLSHTQPNFTAKGVFVSTLDFIKDYYADGKHPVAGVVRVEEDETANAAQGGDGGGEQQGASKKLKLVYEGLAAFKDASLVGFLNGDETSVYNYLIGDTKASLVTMASENENIVLMITGIKPAVKITDGDKITIDIALKATVRLISISSDRDIRYDAVVRQLESEFQGYLQAQITKTIAKVQSEFKSDIFGFGEYMHKQHPKKWEQIKSEWDRHFSEAAVNVSVVTSIVRTGQIKHPFVKE